MTGSPPSELRWRDLWALPTLITLARLPMAVAFVLTVDQPLVALLIYLAGLATDALDGLVARRLEMVSQAGAVADGLSDKAFHAIVAGALIVSGAVPWWWALLWFGREAVQLAMVPWFVWWHFVRGHRRPRHANALGKIATVTLGAAIVAVLAGLPWIALGLSIGTGGFGVAAAISYLLRELRRDDSQPIDE